MPKVKLTGLQAEKQRLQVNLRLAKAVLGKTNDEMAGLIGISTATFSERLKNPNKLTFEEIYLLCQASRIDMVKFMTGKLEVN